MAAAAVQPLLDIRGLTVEFAVEGGGSLRAVDGVSLQLAAGGTLGLVGESGCGKTVTAMSIPRLVPQPPGRIVGGEIRLQGKELLRLPIRELRQIRGRDIGVIFQEPMTALSPLRRIGDQLAEVVLLHRPVSRREALGLGLEWLEKVGIPDPRQRMEAFPFELSGGMRQRVMIAMAMMLQPCLVIADEPTTALDVTIQAQILDLMRAIRNREAGLLLITHDMGVIWEMCERMAVMYASRLVECGSVKEIFAEPLHPYTMGLMRSIPALHDGKGRLAHIPGQVPSLSALPPGCAFADRCEHAMPICRRERPELLGNVNGRQVACHLHRG